MAKEKPSTTPADAPRYVVTVTATSARRRAGFAFGPTPVHLTEQDLDEDKIKALKADPHLAIRPYEEPKQEEPAAQE